MLIVTRNFDLSVGSAVAGAKGKRVERWRHVIVDGVTNMAATRG